MKNTANKLKSGKPAGKRWRGVLVSWVISAFFAAVAALSVQWGKNHGPDIEAVYSRKIYPDMARFCSRITGKLPFSLAEWLLYALILALGAFAVFQLVRVLTRPEKLYRLARLSAIVLAAAAGFYFLFYATWGLNFSRNSLAENLGWQTVPTDTATLRALCESLADKSNAAAEKTLRDPDGCCVLDSDFPGTMRAVAEAWEHTAEDYAFMGQGLYGDPKPVTFSLALCWQQITGVYVPYTFEANVNTMTTAALLPATAAHECAHQRGFPREDEANFLGYLACKHSERPDLVYSGYLLATIYSVNALADVDYEAYNAVCARLSDQVRDDLTRDSQFWKRFEGPVAEHAEKRNDQYLKSNGQASGTKSYGRMVDLLIAEYLREP